MKCRERILVVDDELSVTDAMGIILGERGYAVESAGTAAGAMSLLKGRYFDLAFVDFRLPDSDGMELIGSIKGSNPNTEVILMTAHGSLDVAIEAIKRGAYYYLEKPFEPDQLLALTERALREDPARRAAPAGRQGEFNMIGRSPKMMRVYEAIRAAAASDAPVLIEGESGTGKELVATAIHFQSNRSDRPFTRINCAAIPSELLESEMFGYRRGAFTGAYRDRRGLIEATSGGTLLLDEITEMPTHLQAKLLRVIQERRLRRLGDEREIGVEFRLISTSNRKASEAMEAGLLREDLYYRISTVRIELPPLRERLEDLELLADHFLRRFGAKYNKPVRGISERALELLLRYRWPGNVRELEATIERAVLFSRRDVICEEDLPEQVRSTQIRFKCVIPPNIALEEIEREAIQQTLERTGGNIKRAAQLLKLHRPTLYRRLKKLGIIGKGRAD
jgi:DNA-binding NtrC family response regulator